MTTDSPKRAADDGAMRAAREICNSYWVADRDDVGLAHPAMAEEIATIIRQQVSPVGGEWDDALEAAALLIEAEHGDRHEITARVKAIRNLKRDHGMRSKPTPPPSSADDGGDDPQNWRDIALAATADLRRYAQDETSDRRLASAWIYEQAIARFSSAPPPEQAQEAGALEIQVKAAALAKLLSDPNWQPKRAHMETARNIINELLARLSSSARDGGELRLDQFNAAIEQRNNALEGYHQMMGETASLRAKLEAAEGALSAAVSWATACGYSEGQWLEAARTVLSTIASDKEGTK